MTSTINNIDEYPFNNTGFNYCGFFGQYPELKVTLNGVEYENKSGFDTGKSGGYYVNGYSALNGFENVFLKIYSTIGGTIEVLENITINRKTDRITKYTDMLSGRDEAKILSPYELLNRLKHFVTKRVERTNANTSTEEPCVDCGEMADLHNQMADTRVLCCECQVEEIEKMDKKTYIYQCGICDESIESDDECCGEEFYPLCGVCNKMDEACLCESNPIYRIMRTD